MPIRFACPCGHPLASRDELVGQVVQCPQCRRQLVVPGAVQAKPVRLPRSGLSGLMLSIFRIGMVLGALVCAVAGFGRPVMWVGAIVCLLLGLLVK